MADRVLYELEYVLKASPAIIYNLLSTASGLSQWFADHVNIQDKKYIFSWNDNPENAYLEESIKNELLRWKWEGANEDEYFEITIKKQEMSGDTLLTVKDFSDDDEVENQRLLWDSQIKDLATRTGG